MPSNEKIIALSEYGNFIIPDAADGEFSSEDLAEDMAGVQLNFPRVKIPSGGTLQFELPGDNPQDPEYVKCLDGVILSSHLSNAYWPEAGHDDEENGPPLCSSADGVHGVGEPGGACAFCPLNAFGTGKNGKGKACKNMRQLYLLREGEYMPILLTLSPTSLQPYNNFATTIFAARRRGTCGSVIQIGLKRMNNGKDDYSVATFRKLYDFSGEQLAQIKLYATGFKEQIRAMLQRRTADAETRPDSLIEIEGGGFSVSGYGSIDGDRDALPA
jgi:hypothetical protein